MQIAAQQPFYLPDFYYFSKIFRSDIFLIADHLRFRKQSPIVRTRLDNGKYLTIPVSHQGLPAQPALRKVQLVSDDHWKIVHLRTIRSLYQKLPYFEHYFPELEEIFNRRHQYLSHFLIDLIQWHSVYLGLQDIIHPASRMNINNQAELINWFNNEKDPVWLVHPREAEYYRKEFPQSHLVEIIPANTQYFPENYHPLFPMFILFFLYGPEARMYLAKLS
ncbi:MAG: WbqC family protein [Calditrichota bacterium]|jgi:hypothetical protein